MKHTILDMHMKALELRYQNAKTDLERVEILKHKVQVLLNHLIIAEGIESIH